MHPLMKKMSAGEVVVGMTAAELLRPPLVKIYANAGADFIYIENEHSLLNPATYADFLLCARDNGLPVVAKTPNFMAGESLTFTHQIEADTLRLTLRLPWAPDTETRYTLVRLE